MELRHLRYFVAVAEELHFSRAAERLHVSQPPLSQQIKQLEEEVEVRLFDRNKRWVRLTSAGRLFLEHARQVLRHVDRAVVAARRTMGGECDRLSVASSPWADLMGVPRILRRFSEVHRKIQIEIQTLNSVLLPRAVKTRRVDVGFMFPTSADKAVQTERLVAHPLVVALPSGHRLAACPHLSPRDLEGESYVMLAADVAPMYTWLVAAYWEKAGVAMKERREVDHPHAVIDLVAAGAGFALVPSPVQEHQKKRIVCRRLDPAPPELELSLAWARGVESPAINALIEVARQVVGRPKSRVSGESRAESHSEGSGLSELPPPSRLGDAVRARTNGAHRPGAGSSLLRAPQLTRDGGGKSMGTTKARAVRVPQAS
jgi:DNA-binding transcriptional LysR family regulator